MLARVRTATVHGIDAVPIDVEVDIGKGLPGTTVLGLSDQGAREGRDRVRAALRNTGFDTIFHKVTVNLAPVAVRKEGAFCDLPIALGLLRANGQLTEAADAALARTMVVGELGLDGALRPVRGALALALLARDLGLGVMVLPWQNAEEAAWVRGLQVIGVRCVKEAAGYMAGELTLEPTLPRERHHLAPPALRLDLADVHGQRTAKLALTLAAAGGHNALMIGPPGAGKTMLARALPGILPPLTDEEALEVTRIASVAGILRGGGLLRERPFRAPHHTSTEAALVGGGKPVRPGEVTLAHRGVLFLDELPEFGARKLDTLRQPLEEGAVRIGRACGTLTFPTQVICVAAMNPCPCGRFSAERPCGCSPVLVERYAGRVSGPLRDRFDLTVHLKALPVRALTLAPADAGGPRRGDAAETSAQVRARVVRARDRQLARQGKPNAELQGKEIDRFAPLSNALRGRLADVAEARGLSARQVQRARRVARTAADLAASDAIEEEHLLQALMQLPEREPQTA